MMHVVDQLVCELGLLGVVCHVFRHVFGHACRHVYDMPTRLSLSNLSACMHRRTQVRTHARVACMLACVCLCPCMYAMQLMCAYVRVCVRACHAVPCCVRTPCRAVPCSAACGCVYGMAPMGMSSLKDSRYDTTIRSNSADLQCERGLCACQDVHAIKYARKCGDMSPRWM